MGTSIRRRTYSEGNHMKKLLLLCLFAAGVQAATPIVREGASCPPGYYRSGEYCTPSSQDTKPAISRQGSSCPPNYYRNGDYCVPSKKDVEPPLTRQGSSCPPHYYRNGDYCVKGK